MNDSLLPVRNLEFIRQIPKIGSRIFEAIQDLQYGVSSGFQQANINPTGDPVPPPNPQSLSVTGQNGHFNFAITDQSSGLLRGTSYFVEHADNPSFVNSETIELGQVRNGSKFLGNVTRYFRAYSAASNSATSQHVYHGTAFNPTPVSGGGVIGGPSFQASQGTGTGAPGQGGVGPGPVLVRDQANGFDWTRQRAQGGKGGFEGSGTPAGNGALGPSGGGGGGGGGSVTTSEPVIAACEWLKSVSGTNTVVAVTATPYQALVAGFVVRFVPANTNSGAVTLNVNSTGAKAVTKNGTTALVGGELQAGRGYLLVYDGTRWQIIGPSFPVSALVLASDASGNPAPAALADTKIWIGQGSGLPAAETISGDATLADTGALTLATVNGSPGTFGDATHTVTITVNAKGLVTAASQNTTQLATKGANATVTFSLTAPAGGGAVTGTITVVQV